MRVVPFPVPSPASSGTVVFRVPYWNWILCMLKICYPLHKVDVNYLLSDDVWWPCNDHGTVSIDNNSIRLIPLIDLWIFTPQFSIRLVRLHDYVTKPL